MVSLNLKPRLNKTRCPYCHDDLSGELVECNSCSASHHSECWDELQVCAACSRSNTLHNLRVALQKRRLEFPDLRTFSGFISFGFDVLLFIFGFIAIILVDIPFIIMGGLISLLGVLFEAIGFFISILAGFVALIAELLIFCIPLLFTVAIVLKLMGVW